MHPSHLDARQNWFLSKTGKLLPCTPTEAAIIKRNDGVLYYPVDARTTPVIVFKTKFDVLKCIARNVKDYTIEFELFELCYERPLAWGYLRRDAYFEADCDCQKLWEDFLDDENNPQPVYYSTALDKDDEAKIPEIVRAKIDVLRIVDKGGKVIGGDRIDG